MSDLGDMAARATTDPWETKVVDMNDKPIQVGSRVTIGTEHVWTVTRITDPDGDVDDDGRSIAIPPYIYVRLDGTEIPDTATGLSPDGEYANFRTYFTGRGWWDEDAPFACDDLEVIADEPPATDPRPDPRTHPEYWTE